MNGSGIKRDEHLRVTFCAYREWALEAVRQILVDSDIELVDIIKSNSEYLDKVFLYPDGHVDCIVLIGWSWIIKDDTLRRFLCVGMHPSDLPMYRGGSPIQHQIIDGLERTKISLMTISPEGVDMGDIWMKEDWDMRGDTMQEVLKNLTDSTSKLLKCFFEKFDKLTPQTQDLSKGTYFNRRKPTDSKVTWECLSAMKLKDVYNLIRALGDPYPNIYIEDEDGNRLKFKTVEYCAKSEDNRCLLQSTTRLSI